MRKAPAPEHPRRFSRRMSVAAMAFSMAVIVAVLIWRDTSPIAEAVVAWGFATIAAILAAYQGARLVDLKRPTAPVTPAKEKDDADPDSADQ